MPTKHKEIDKVLAEWRQGDVVLGKQPFVYIADPNRALTPESESAKSTGHFQIINKEVDGLVVVTQSCDIVRDCKDRPFKDYVESDQLDLDHLSEGEKRRRAASQEN